jgi:hypothetical protein
VILLLKCRRIQSLQATNPYQMPAWHSPTSKSSNSTPTGKSPSAAAGGVCVHRDINIPLYGSNDDDNGVSDGVDEDDSVHYEND